MTKGVKPTSDRTNRMENFTGFSSATDAYAYDATDQLTGVSYSGGARTANYGYDAMGNLTNRLDTGSGTNTFTANNLNQLSTLNSQALNYDLKGNLTNRPGWLYTWNAKNQLTIAEKSNPAEGSKKMTFAYDGRNRCVKRRTYTYTSGNWSLTLDTCLYYQSWNLIEERDGSGNVIAAFANGPVIDEVLAKFTSTNTVHYHGDALNSTLVLTDPSANVAERYRYDAFGLASTYDFTFSSLPSSTHSIRHLFQGREWLIGVKLYDHRNRLLLPELQRWPNRDPIAEFGGLNLFAFVNNSPLIMSDAFGLDPASDYVKCMEDMKAFDTCGYGFAVVGPPALFPRGPVGIVCRKLSAGLTGWCAGVSWGCMINAFMWWDTSNPRPLPPPPAFGCSNCSVNTPPAIRF